MLLKSDSYLLNILDSKGVNLKADVGADNSIFSLEDSNFLKMMFLVFNAMKEFSLTY